jgi:predicted pyridoxine 5'-phosphate oxidase superfamily flavin-nucleotide-binding protein
MSTLPPHAYHEGELELQRLTGESERARANARALSGEIVRGALAFVAEQPFVLAAALDASGRPWAWIVAGAPGFVQARSPRELRLQASGAAAFPAELRAWLAVDGRIGLLFFEPSTRRRLRVNGRARWLAEDELEVQVEQAYPNCPQYIQRRAVSASVQPGPELVTRGQRLGASQLEAIRRADALFVASRGPDGRLDISHRGGAPGFVRIDSEGELRIPDYAGNSMFNTLGNLLRDPRAGLLFVDFERGELLQLSGTTRLELEERAPAAEERPGGRGWTFRTSAWRASSGAFPLRALRLA